MKNTRFETFLSQLKETNAPLHFYSDFRKIAQNVADIEISLNALNYLIGKEDLRTAVQNLYKRDPQAFQVMDILIATREKDHKMFLDKDGVCKPIHSLFGGVDDIIKFLEGTGLAEVFRKKEVKDLVDYVFGVETGLDTNARKNRSGNITETEVSRMFKEAGIKAEEQVSSHNFPPVAKALGVDQKVFDFVIKTEKKTYLIETNFYSGGGSKLNEVARSYTDLAAKLKPLRQYEFVWITDGIGWQSAKNKLEEAFNAIPSIYNFTTLPDFIKRIK